MVHALAGKPAPASALVDLVALERAYYEAHPDPEVPLERVAFGTSGHRGSSLRRTFNEDHIVAITEAICDYRASQGIEGPLYLGIDTHALSAPAQRTALEVLAARGVEVRIAEAGAYTPTPVVSHAILAHNRKTRGPLADGIVVTPSHNPPEDGGFKYDPPHGGPADSKVTGWIESRANALLRSGVGSVRRIPYDRAIASDTVRTFDYVTPYVEALAGVIDMDAIARAKLRIGVDPMGGANVGFWGPIAARYGLDLTVVNPDVDKTFAFMPLDHDGKIRMDCSSPYAMANLVAARDRFDLAFGNDADSDRHGIVTKSVGLMNPNHYLAVAIDYLFRHRTGWSPKAAVGKTAVSSAIIDRVARALGRPLAEVPVGFKWFVDGLADGSLGFGGEESAGAAFLCKDGTTWTTDKDGILLDLLAAEIQAVTGEDAGARYAKLEAALGKSYYARLDVAASAEARARLKAITPAAFAAARLAGDPVVARSTKAPHGGGDLGGLKVASDEGWFAVRPSGTEDIYKVYAESFRSDAHLQAILGEARATVAAVTR